MKSCWIVLLCALCLFFNASSANAPEWSVNALSSADTHSEVVHSSFKSRWKREAAPQDYVVDIEISFPDSSFMESFKMFLKELNDANAFPASDVINITGVAVTTECSLNATTVQCSCEDGYNWPSDTCVARPNCSSTTKGCDCISSLPPDGVHCQPVPPTMTTMKSTTPITTVTSTTPTIKQTTVMTTTRSIKAPFTYQLIILEPFSAELNNKTSLKYITYKTKFETQFYKSYRNLTGFASVNVTGFRNGSVNVDYVIFADPPTPSSLAAANTEIVNSLSGQFTFPPSPFLRIIYAQTNFTTSPDVLFQGDTLTLTCSTRSNSTSVSWTQNGVPVKISATNTIKDGVSKSVLVIPSITTSHAGEYSCSLNDTTVIYVASRTVNVSTINTSFDSNKYVLCDGKSVQVFQWCTDGDISYLTCGCTPSGGLSINGTKTTVGKCQKFELQAVISLCPAEMSGKGTSYRCQCSREGRELILNTMTVTFVRKATVTITGSTTMSAADTLSLECRSDVPTYDSMTWQVVTKAGGSPDLQEYYKDNTALSIPAVRQSWEGTYTCTVSQRISSSSNSTVVTVLPLPSASQLSTNIVDGISKCPFLVPLQCCTTDSNKYSFQFKVQGSSTAINAPSDSLQCYETTYNYNSCENDKTAIDCIVSNGRKSISTSITLRPLKGDPTCAEIGYGDGKQGDTITISCTGDLDGTITYTCNNGKWEMTDSQCIPKKLTLLVTASQELQAKPPTEIPVFLENLNSTITAAKESITTFATVNAVVDILQTLSEVTKKVDDTMMQNFLNTANVIVKKQDTWTTVNETQRIEGGSRLLQSTEVFSQGLQINDTIERVTDSIILKGTFITNETASYQQVFNFRNATGNVQVANETLATIRNFSLITIAYSELNNILTATQNKSVNGLVMSTVVNSQNGTDSSNNFKISMMFDKINSSLSNASCVFWQFKANGSGDWDTEGCRASEQKDKVICTCDHLTAFSVLMSSSSSSPPGPITAVEKKERETLEYITYIGVGISMGSLVLCLIIETLVWKSVTKNKTSFMRHVCLVNIAVSLLIADIWFIIGASLTPQLSNQTYSNATTSTAQACDSATFFAHFFYLSLFFWMLTMGLILFYRLVFVLSDMSKKTMLAIAFSLGYGCPLIISVVTVAVTRPQNYYREGNSCWLNIMNTRAFLAFVVPALTIVAVNFVILAVVIITLLRPSVGDKPRKEEKSNIVKIAKSVAILTPLLGLTWGFGIGTLIINTFALNVIFTLLNSLQGFFILVFASLMDAKTREAILRQFSLTRWASQLTKSSTNSTTRTPPTTPKSTPSKPKARFFGKRGAYNLSSALQSNSNDESSHSYSTLQ